MIARQHGNPRQESLLDDERRVLLPEGRHDQHVDLREDVAQVLGKEGTPQRLGGGGTEELPHATFV
jgi:hypothetical protein